jgi:hypothetical protein
VVTTHQIDLRQYHDQVIKDKETRLDWKERIEPLAIELENKEVWDRTL